MEAFETDRLILRNVVLDDAQDIYEYSSNIHVGIDAGWPAHKSIDETLETMKLIFVDKETIWGIVLKDSKKLIGTIGLIDDPKRENEGAKMLGYALSYDYWGRGIMSEAAKAVIEIGFKQLKLDIISAYCYPYNEASKRVMVKNGLSYEGLLRQAEKRFDGLVFDNECYSVTKEEFFGL